MSTSRNSTLTIDGIDKLDALGINPLTGEADPFGYRILCDLSLAGAYRVSQYLGLPATEVAPPFALNWNSWVGEATAVYSVLLPRVLLRDPEFWAFLLMCGPDANTSGYEFALEYAGTVTGANKGHWRYSQYVEGINSGRIAGRIHKNPGMLRNTHAMTGREV